MVLPIPAQLTENKNREIEQHGASLCAIQELPSLMREQTQCDKGTEYGSSEPSGSGHPLDERLLVRLVFVR